MKLNFNKPLLEIDGTAVSESNLGKGLATSLAYSKKGDSIKYWGWALKLDEGKELELDKSDYDTLKSFIKENEGLIVMIKAQLLEVMGEFKQE